MGSTFWYEPFSVIYTVHMVSSSFGPVLVLRHHNKNLLTERHRHVKLYYCHFHYFVSVPWLIFKELFLCMACFLSLYIHIKDSPFPLWVKGWISEMNAGRNKPMKRRFIATSLEKCCMSCHRTVRGQCIGLLHQHLCMVIKNKQGNIIVE